MLTKLKKTFRSLTYRDMVTLSTELSEKLPDCAEPGDVAAVLLDLPLDMEDDSMEFMSNDVLSRMFSRKKQLTIQPEGEDVFKICCPSVEGAVVYDRNIREGVSQLLDTLTVLQGFNDG